MTNLQVGEFTRWIDLLKKKELPPVVEIKRLCGKVKEILSSEPNVLNLQPPMTVVGDIHGQFYDLIEMFDVAGHPPETNYLFMGDYVDRGHYSVETLLLLFALKIRYPCRIHLIRGNHETRQITQVYGFYDECMKKFGCAEVWNLCAQAFDNLPIAALLGKRSGKARFAVHAGLTPSCDTIDQIMQIERVGEVPHEGPMCDLLWSDPEDMGGAAGGWGISPRGAGYIFGSDIVKTFNNANDVMQICRSHQLVMNGYRAMFDGGLCTVWSAPNYCYRCGNAGAVVQFDENFNEKKMAYGPCPPDERKKPKDSNTEMLPDYFL